MQRSTDRILTTHSGSLVRTREIIRGMKAKTIGQPYDEATLTKDIKAGVTDVVRQQVEAGIDIPNDGEYPRRGFLGYVHERMGGLEARPPETEESVLVPGRERDRFAEFSELYDKHFRFVYMYPDISMEEVKDTPAIVEKFRLTGPITYIGQQAVQSDIANLKSALNGLNVADAFLSAATPTFRQGDRDVEKYYSNKDDYWYALADAMHEEYKAITDAGLVLQLDFAALNPQGLVNRNMSGHDALHSAREQAIEILNHALRDIPEERVRYHHCWGSNNRPHTSDGSIREIIPQMLKIKAQAYGFEAANPRHEHEWMVWKDFKLPEGKIVVPGFISQSTNVVEHPELISLRIQNFASVVGKENLIAGVDCGFSQYWDQIRCHPSVQWAKLEALAEGAALASKALWGR
jgi:5-methyltetrahydropteroyltriglutamate--homocysteine methyltransferase